MRGWTMLAMLCSGVLLAGCVGSQLGTTEECPAGTVSDGSGGCKPACVGGCQPDDCGTFVDACGTVITCDNPCNEQSCGTQSHKCTACIPETCEDVGAECGTFPSSCSGAPVDCGACREGDCGTFGAGPNGCPCAPPRHEFVALRDDPSNPDRNVVVAGPYVSTEGGVTWLYYSTNLEFSVLPGLSLSRVPLTSATEIATDGIEVIAGTADGKGWVSCPNVTANGLELVFSGNKPDALDAEIYLSHRAAVTEPWPAAVLVEALGALGGATDAQGDVYSPLLLPDGRTLLYSLVGDPGRPGTGIPSLARRSTTTPGDLSFVPLGAAFPDDDPGTNVWQQKFHNYHLACDGQRILYTRELFITDGTDRADHREIAFTISGDTVTFGTPEAYSRVPLPKIDADRTKNLGFAEADDCKTVYFGGNALEYRATTCE